MEIDFSEQLIRDPLYGFIGTSKTEQRVIDSSIFRRLLDIKQLSHEYIVYPSATHTRFEHSLGVMHLAGEVCDKLNSKSKARHDKLKLDSEFKEIVRLAALLHDVGHGPYSHLFEKVLENINGKEISHEWITQLMISKDLELQEILGEKAKKIIQVLNDDTVTGWDKKISNLASSIISSGLDVDRMDYLQRDSYHIGVAYGRFDLARILHTIDYAELDSYELCIAEKGKDAVENYRFGRYFMHSQAYQHHTRLSADQMLLRGTEMAVNDKILPIDKLKIDVESLDKNTEFLKYYRTLDDRSIYDKIISPDPHSTPAQILKNIKKRNLLKRSIDIMPNSVISNSILRRKMMTMDYKELRELDMEIVDELKTNYSETISHISRTSVNPNSPNNTNDLNDPNKSKKLKRRTIMVLINNTPKNIEELSPIQIKPPNSISRFFVFTNANKDIRERVCNHVKKKFEINNTNCKF